MNESTFEICPHDKENPYVMISREMAQDKSISPKAKGVLLYLLSLPKDWKIYHCQLQVGLNVGEDYINSAMDELINAGYADRTRERIKGIFQPYKYKIREFKKCLPNGKNPSGSSTEIKEPPQLIMNQTGLAGPVNPGLQSKEKESKYKNNCSVPVGDSKNNLSLLKIEKLNSKKEKIIFVLEEIFLRALREKKDWTTSEIEEAWKILENYPNPVNCGFKIIEGIINNLRKKQNKPETKIDRKQTKALSSFDKIPTSTAKAMPREELEKELKRRGII